jgi:hypothetical protein
VEEKATRRILLFLVHLSRDGRILDALLMSASTIFSASPRTGLLTADSPVPMFDTLLKAAVYEDRPTTEHRRSLMEHNDKTEEAAEEERQAEETRRTLRELSGAFKTIQLLGQALKNNPGAMTRVDKLKTIDAILGAGMRTLGWLFALIRSNADDLIQSLVRTIRLEEPDASAEEILRRSNESLQGLTLLSSYGMTRRIVSALAAPELVPVIADPANKDIAPAEALIATGVLLEAQEAFPMEQMRALVGDLRAAKNWLAKDVLALLVLNHFHLFHVRFDVKQAACAALEIEYKSVQGGGLARLLPSKGGGSKS